MAGEGQQRAVIFQTARLTLRNFATCFLEGFVLFPYSTAIFLAAAFICVQWRPPLPTTASMATMKIPTRHKAVVYDNPGNISVKVVEIDTPEPGAGEVLIKMYVSLSTKRPL